MDADSWNNPRRILQNKEMYKTFIVKFHRHHFPLPIQVAVLLERTLAKPSQYTPEPVLTSFCDIGIQQKRGILKAPSPTTAVRGSPVPEFPNDPSPQTDVKGRGATAKIPSPVAESFSPLSLQAGDKKGRDIHKVPLLAIAARASLSAIEISVPRKLLRAVHCRWAEEGHKLGFFCDMEERISIV